MMVSRRPGNSITPPNLNLLECGTVGFNQLWQRASLVEPASRHGMNMGLTGGIGCGKSTALKFFAEAGATTVDTDAVVRELLASDRDLIAQIRDAFGPEVVDTYGKVDRGQLGRTVFRNSRALAHLESLVHPRVRHHWTRMLQENHPVLIVEIPLLFERDLHGHFSATICVSCYPEVSVNRLKSRGMTESQIQYRQQHQFGLEEKMRRADIVLHNNSSPDHLREQVDWIMRRLDQFSS